MWLTWPAFQLADAPRPDAFRQGLRDDGYIEGQNILIETRHEGRDLERLPEEAAELIGRKPDVFVAVTTNAVLAAKKATGNIPVVFMGVTDPVKKAGLVQSLVSRVAVLWDQKRPAPYPNGKKASSQHTICRQYVRGPITPTMVA